MYDWEKLTKDALQDLGAESLMVPRRQIAGTHGQDR